LPICIKACPDDYWEASKRKKEKTSALYRKISKLLTRPAARCKRMIFFRNPTDCPFASRPVPIHREQKEHSSYSNKFYVLSFACAKERTKEKHIGNDLQPLPDALIKLQYYC
jgi:hypothetical protein